MKKKSMKKSKKKSTKKNPTKMGANVVTDASSYDPLLELKVKNYYDILDAKVSAENRQTRKAQVLKLSEKDKEMMNTMQGGLEKLLDIIFKDIKSYVNKKPLWKGFFNKIAGCGELMAAVIMTNIDIHRATTVSKMFAVAGLGFERKYRVVYRQLTYNKAGKVTKETKVQTAEVWAPSETSAINCIPRAKMDKKTGEPIDCRTEAMSCTLLEDKPRIQQMNPGQCLTYNKFLKAKMLGVLTRSMIMNASIKNITKDTHYVEIYRDSKTRYAKQHPEDPKWPLRRIDKAAKRKMIKALYKDLYQYWRTQEGLETRVPYEEEYLNKKHSGKGGASGTKKQK